MMLLLSAITGVNAMTYAQARDQALFLTDKMAYELNLNDDQYEAAYEINLDYLMSVDNVDDVYALSWTRRNTDMRYILFDWQYDLYLAASYFYRPIYWSAGVWHFGIYAHYPRRDFFFFSRPAFYLTYRGGHSWRYNGGVSWYKPRVNHYRNVNRVHNGMRDRHNGIQPRNGMRQESRATGAFRQQQQRNNSSYNTRSVQQQQRNNSQYERNNSSNNRQRQSMTSSSGKDKTSISGQETQRNFSESGSFRRQSSTRSTVGNTRSSSKTSSSKSTATKRSSSGSTRSSSSKATRSSSKSSSTKSSSSASGRR